MNEYRRGYQPVIRNDWTDTQNEQLSECAMSLNLNDGPKFSEKEYIANLVNVRANGGGITDKQAALLVKIYNRRVLCVSERPRHEQ